MLFGLSVELFSNMVNAHEERKDRKMNAMSSAGKMGEISLSTPRSAQVFLSQKIADNVHGSEKAFKAFMETCSALLLK
jgi:hypothetical protein